MKSFEQRKITPAAEIALRNANELAKQWQKLRHDKWLKESPRFKYLFSFFWVDVTGMYNHFDEIKDPNEVWFYNVEHPDRIYRIVVRPQYIRLVDDFGAYFDEERPDAFVVKTPGIRFSNRWTHETDADEPNDNVAVSFADDQPVLNIGTYLTMLDDTYDKLELYKMITKYDFKRYGHRRKHKSKNFKKHVDEVLRSFDYAKDTTSIAQSSQAESHAVIETPASMSNGSNANGTQPSAQA